MIAAHHQTCQPSVQQPSHTEGWLIAHVFFLGGLTTKVNFSSLTAPQLERKQ